MAPSPDDPTAPARPIADGISISLAVSVVGVTFGVLARTAGLSVAQTCAMSLLVFTGASQLAAVGAVAQAGSTVAVLGTSLLLAARNTLYGPVVAPWIADTKGIARAALTQLVIDESAGVGAAQPDAASADPALARRGFLAAGVGIYVTWNLGTALGALAGNLVGDVAAWGLDAAFPASFVALLAPHLRQRPGRVAAIAGSAITISAVPFLPVGIPVFLAAIGVLPAWRSARTAVRP